MRGTIAKRIRRFVRMELLKKHKSEKIHDFILANPIGIYNLLKDKYKKHQITRHNFVKQESQLNDAFKTAYNKHLAHKEKMAAKRKAKNKKQTM